MALDSTAQRHDWYREMGWWCGQRLQDCYQGTADQRPGDLAVADSRGRSLTHQQLWQQAGELAQSLSVHGVDAGDLVLLYAPNWVEWQTALLAILRADAVPAPLPVTSDANTLAYVCDLIGATLIVSGDTANNNSPAKAARHALKSCNRAPGLLLLSEHGEFTWEANVSGEGGQCSDSAHPASNLDMVMFTSSTTGKPKAVMHTADTLGALNYAFSERFSLGPDQPIFMASPLGHSVGAYHGSRLALYTGAPLILQETWQPTEAIAMIERYACVFTAAATPFLKDLIDAPWTATTTKLATLRTFLCGGAPVPPILLGQALKQLPNTFVTNLWGMTEGGLTTCVPDSPMEKVVSTAGIGLPGLELRILDQKGCAQAPGQEGELAMRGPGVFYGYFGQQELYDSLLTAEKFFRTEDLARIDEQGYLQITGRIKDLIIRGGVNISPIPIEDVLARHPDINSVAVIGVADERMGERICAVLQVNGGKPSLESLQNFAQSNGLAKRNCPECLFFVDAMPRTAGGKIRKADLRETIISSGYSFSALREKCSSGSHHEES